MTNLSIQYRILYQLYDSLNNGEQVTISSLKQKEFKFLPTMEYESELFYLEKANYLTKSSQGVIEISGLGIRTTEILFGKFLDYIKLRHKEELFSFIGIFEYYNNQRTKQVSEIFFHIHRQPEVKRVFSEYLVKVDRIENVEGFEIGSLFDPEITIVSRRFFVLSFGVSASISGLSPSKDYQIWIFYPDGNYSNTYPLRSDNHGNLFYPSQENLNNPPLGSSSSPIIKGQYILAINEGTFKYSNKTSFQEWERSNLEKNYLKFYVDYKKETILHLDEITQVPWGTEAIISGQLWFKDEPFLETSGAEWFRGRRITFTGSYVVPEPAMTDEYSKFFSNLKAGLNVKKDCTFQAHFEGDGLFDRADSDVIRYNTTKHKTNLDIMLNNLKLSLGKKTSKTLDTGQSFRIEGKLHDLVGKAALGDESLTLQTDMPSISLFAKTLEDGSFSLSELRAPSAPGQYYVRVSFPENDKYYSSNSEVKVQVIERETPAKKDIIGEDLGESDVIPELGLKKVFINYAREDEEKATRLYNDLNSLGNFDIWFDRVSILPGQKWEKEIEKGIQSSDYIILLFSKSSVRKKGTVQTEYKLALEALKRIPEDQIFIIPARLDECNIPYEYRNYQYTDLFLGWDIGLEKIKRALGVAK